MPQTFTAPDAADMENGAQYFFKLSLDHHAPGAVCDKQGAVVLTYASRPLGFGKRDVVFRTPDGKEAARVFRLRGPAPRFIMIEKGEVTASISAKGLLRGRYKVEFRTGPSWTFEMPKLAPQFYGVSETGARMWAQSGASRKELSLLFQPGADNIPLVAALAFIHRLRERWR